jgi:hypothetical protein
MSYNADHRFWQQRIGSEMGAYRKYSNPLSSSRFFDKIMMSNSSNLPPALYETLNK